MNTTAIVLQGKVRPEGTLELDEKIPLPAGRVQVTVQPAPELSKDPFWQGMQHIWADQKARGHIPRGVEEVERERKEFREEAEAEIQEAIRLQEECRQARGQTQEPDQ